LEICSYPKRFGQTNLLQQTFVLFDKLIEYWTKGAEDDLLPAELLIREKRILHGLLFLSFSD